MDHLLFADAWERVALDASRTDLRPRPEWRKLDPPVRVRGDDREAFACVRGDGEDCLVMLTDGTVRRVRCPGATESPSS